MGDFGGYGSGYKLQPRKRRRKPLRTKDQQAQRGKRRVAQTSRRRNRHR